MLEYRSFIALFVVVLSSLLFACQPATTGYYRGATVAGLEPISLSDHLEGEQLWHDLYLRVSYQLQQSGERLNIKGRMGFSDSSKTNYIRVADMKLKLFLLDQDLRVIDSMTLARVLGYNLEDETEFDQSLVLDRHVVALAFGYDGALVEDDSEFSSVHPVWKIPKK